MIGCSNDSGDGSGISFYIISTVSDRYGEVELELRKKQRDGFLAAISREDLDVTALYICTTCVKGTSILASQYIYTIPPTLTGYPPYT